MTLKNKQELIRLLNLYCLELCADNDKNLKGNGLLYNGFYKVGVKSQYEHARIIVAKLSREIGNELKAY